MSFRVPIEDLSILDMKLHLVSGFGRRVHPIKGYEHFHKGVDINRELRGRRILASESGRVTYISRDPETECGLSVNIDHGKGWLTKYKHLDAVFVSMNQFVRKGDSIGILGATGQVTGPHLHFQMEYEGEPVNPFDYIEEPKVLVGIPALLMIPVVGLAALLIFYMAGGRLF